jgi:hypothetical protein
MLPQPLKIILIAVNCAVLISLCLLIAHHVKCSYNLKSFSFLFYILSFVWLIIRGFFWVATLTTSVDWTSAQYYFLYWMPVPVEFGSFMLLPLYFAQILYPEEWEVYYKTGRRAYIAIVLGLVVGQVIYIMMELVSEVTYSASDVRNRI